MSPSSERPGGGRPGRWAALVLGAAAALGTVATAVCAGDDVAAGRRIYLEGVLPSGQPLTGLRFDSVAVSGREAACVNCHRRSGLGSVEGDIQVAPISGHHLFDEPDKTRLATMDPRRGKRFNLAHAPYDDATLAAAVRDGIHVSGRSMAGMMPRFRIDEPAMKALTAYLRQLSAHWSPGVDDESIRFATVIAPGVDAARRQVLVDMLKTAFNQKNASTVGGRQGVSRRHMVSAAEMVLGTERKWQLDVWDLQGPPETWRAQLEEFHARAPVFAVVSGLSDTTWQPVHDFCESQGVPCWFPSVDLPDTRAGGFYSVYFTRGVALEADVLASHLLAAPGPRPARLVQIHRDDVVGRGAAEAMKKALAGASLPVETRSWRPGDGRGLSRALRGIGAGDAAMIWARREDLPLLAEQVPPQARAIYFSGQLAAGEKGLPAAWKRQARLVYPFELPQKRAANLNYFHTWLRMRKLPLVDEPMQSEVYFALGFLTDTVAEMLDNLYRDYLLERAETMIGRREGTRAQEETRDRQQLTRVALLAAVRGGGDPAAWQDSARLDERQSTTIFPRLGLAPGQRFASKGAYIVRFADAHSDTVVAESDWIVP